VRLRPVIGGALALLITFRSLSWGWLALFTSMYGLMIAAVISHGVGTAVAMVLELPSPTRNIRPVCWRLVVATLCALFLWIVTSTLIQSWPRVFYVHNLGIVAGSAIAYALCAIVARRVEPSWHRYAGSLALVALVVTSTFLMIRMWEISGYSPPAGHFAPSGANGPSVPVPERLPR
jgi:hypothetical protein